LKLSKKGSGIRHVLVTQTLANKLELRIHGKPVHVNIDELLSVWHGHYLLVWQPNSNRQYLYPNKISTEIIWLRKSLNQADGKKSPTTKQDFYDNNLMARVLTFQRKNQLLTDGVVGPRTMIHLQNLSNTADFPTLH
jgi:general secretion pathway protein A